jgi:hypothetical protein
MSMSPRVRVAPVTHAWTCVLLWPILARVIKIFEPMNTHDSQGGDSARRRLSPMNIDDLPPNIGELCLHFEIGMLRERYKI